MNTVKHVFWNEADRRLRAGWRLIIQVMLLLLGIGCLGMFLGVIGVIQGMVSGDAPTITATAATISQQPLFLMMSSVTTLFAVLLSVGLTGRFVDRRPFADFGFHFSPAWWRDLGFGLALGALLMAGIFLFEWALGWIEITDTLQINTTQLSFTGAILLQVIIFLSVGIYEELFSRGYQLQNLAEGLGGLLGSRGAIVAAWLLSSSVFGILHAGNPNATLVSTVNLVIAGLFLGLGYVLTRDLAIPIGLHITWNFFQGNVFGFPVSGGASAVSFISVEQGGPELWTGGAFGPEAGLIGLGAIALGSLLTVLWVRWQHGEATLRPELVEYTPPTRPDQPSPEAPA